MGIGHDATRTWYSAVSGGYVGDNNLVQTGRLVDHLRITETTRLVASPTSGVWFINEFDNFAASPLSSSWTSPTTTRIRRGPFGDRHFFAVCGQEVYESQYGGDLFDQWTSIGLPTTSAGLRPVVHDLTVLTYGGLPALVLATSDGLWWSPMNLGSPYYWLRATLPMGAPFSAFLSVGQRTFDAWSVTNLNDNEALVGMTGGANGAGGIYGTSLWRASWTGTVTASPVPLSGAPATNVTAAVCAGTPTRVWAIGIAGDQSLGDLWRSDDGGKKFTIAGDLTTVEEDGFGTAGLHLLRRISVHPSQPDVIGLGGRSPLLSVDGGKNWRVHDKPAGKGTGGVHSDTYYLDFPDSPLEWVSDAPVIDGLTIVSDGGVFVRRGESWSGALNQNLGCLQMYGRRNYGFWGYLSQRTNPPFITAVGTQDNHNLWCDLSVRSPVWRSFCGGDGGAAAVTVDGSVVGTIATDTARPVMVWPSAGAGAAGHPSTNDQVVAVNTGQATLPEGLPGAFELSRFPGVGPDGTKQLLGFGWVWSGNNFDYGSKDDSKRWTLGSARLWGAWGPSVRYDDAGTTVTQHEFSPLADIPLVPGAMITAVAGAEDEIFVGTSDGKIYRIVRGDGSYTASLVDVWAGVIGDITEICRDGTSVWAISDRAVLRMERGDSYAFFVDATGDLAPFAPFHAVATRRVGRGREVFVASRSQVFVTKDNGATWLAMSDGLPEAPSCACLAVGADVHGPALLLATHGWGLWSTRLDP
jgi:hypothetical protein